ncbi:MAG: hypothetical protein K2Y71_03025 [Xanthobacteraceae bacterium]|nr:hypothetical protein [Xanthobacteraceae bacterium]
MASEAQSARRKAARYLALAMEARDKGNFELAELLTKAATAAFDEAEAQEAVQIPPAATVEPPQAPIQQQQQVQPDDEPGKHDKKE